MTSASLNVEILDNAIRDILPEDAILEQVATGFAFTEGPVWCGDYLLFSDIPMNRIIKLQMLKTGPEVTTYQTPSGNSNGLTLDNSQRLIACEHSGRRVTLTEIDGSAKVLADSYQGRRLNSPNDVVVRSDGSVYFTDPPYGLRNYTDWKELPCHGVYRITPNGELFLIADDFDRPNGLAFSPDESVLYIDDTVRQHVRAFDVAPDGGISNSRVLIEMRGEGPGRPDGMKVDMKGNIYCTGPGGFWVIDPAGKCLARVRMPEITPNLAWGDSDWQTLYLTAQTSVYRIKTLAPGIPAGHFRQLLRY